MSAKRRLAAAAAVCTTTLVAAGTLATGGAHAATPATTSFPGSVPSWATHANDAGAPADDPEVEGQIFLTLPDYNAAKAEALSVSTPGNPNFRKYMSPSDWITKYAPTKAAFTQVASFLKNNGLTVIGAPTDREYLVFRGPESVVYGTFGTTAHRFNFGGQKLLAPTSAPKVPSSLGSLIEGVSIDQGKSLARPDYVHGDSTPYASAAAAKSQTAKPNASGVPVPTCSTYWDQNEITLPAAYGKTSFPTILCGLTSSQISGAYGTTKLLTNGIDGKGQTIAIVDAYASPSIFKDSQLIEAQTGTPQLTSAQFADISAPKSSWDDEELCAEPSGWQTEEHIDVQIAHGMAPGANIIYAGAFDCEGGLDLQVSHILDNKTATIITNSYGDLGEALSANTLIGEQSKEFQAAAEGIGLYYSSGDSGDEQANLGVKSPDFEASSPYVTAVGGTSLAVSNTNSYQFEIGWGTHRDQVIQNKDGSLGYAGPLPGTYNSGAGGGVSTNFAEPAYQQGVVPSALASTSTGPGRVVPDVAALADPDTGFGIGVSPIVDDNTLQTGAFEFERFGGTSLASPLVAGEIALAQQATGADIGFANPALYALAKSTPTAFHDVAPFSHVTNVVRTVGTGTYLITLDTDSSLTTAKGYDEVTGNGSLTVPGLMALANSK